MLNHKISICIPLYNPDMGYLKAAVNSVLAQTSQQWQLYLIDGSPESQVHIANWVDELNNSKVSYQVNNDDRSMAGNWNCAFSLAKSDLVTLLHDDDLLLPHYVERMLKFGADKPNSSAYFCNVLLIDDMGERVFTVADSIKRLIQPSGDLVTLKEDDGLAQLLKGTFIFCPTICYRKSKLPSIPFSTRWNMVADLHFYAETLINGGEIIGVNEKLYVYRRHNNNQTAKLTQDLKRFDEEVALYSDIAEKASSLGWTDTEKVAKKKRIIKLHLLFLTVKSILLFDFKRCKQVFGYLCKLMKGKV